MALGGGTLAYRTLAAAEPVGSIDERSPQSKGMLTRHAVGQQKGAEKAPADLAPPQSKDAKTDLERLHGAWTLVEMETRGKKLTGKNMTFSGAPLKSLKLAVDGEHFPDLGAIPEEQVTDPKSPRGGVDVQFGGYGPIKGEFVLNETKKPKQITMGGFLLNWASTYKLEGNTLTICFNPKNPIRPDEFRTMADSDRVLFVFKRDAAARKNEAKENVKPIFSMRVHIEKVNADSRSINASCMLIGEIDGITKPLRLEHLFVSENAKIKQNGKDLKFTDMKSKMEVLLEVEAASEIHLMVVGIEAGKLKPSQGVVQKRFKMRVHVEKVNADSRTITASCMILGAIDNVWKPLRFEHLSVSENAKIKINGKDLKLTDLKPGTGVFLELEAASVWELKAVGIETVAKANPGVDAGQLGDGDKKGANEPIAKEPILAKVALSDAIKEANEKASKDAIGKDETPVTEQEIIAGIRALQRPKDLAVTDKLFDAFKRIAETRQLPPGAAIETVGGLWDPGADFVYDVWWVRIEMPKEDGGTYSFPVRQRIIRSRTLQEELVRIEKGLQDLPEAARQLPGGNRLQERIDDLKARIAKMKAK